MFTPIELVGYAAMIGIWVGLYLLTLKLRLGWLVGLAGCILWVIYGVILGLLPIIVTDIVFCGINIHGYMKWKK
jgi:hypothetical protein